MENSQWTAYGLQSVKDIWLTAALATAVDISNHSVCWCYSINSINDTVGQDEYKHKSFIAVKHRNTHNVVDFVSKTVPQKQCHPSQDKCQPVKPQLHNFHQPHIPQRGNKCQFTASDVYLYYIRIENYSQTSEFQACKFELK